MRNANVLDLISREFFTHLSRRRPWNGASLLNLSGLPRVI